MGKTTPIEWTDATWNPWHGCTKVSPGCKFCYMYRDKERYGQDPHVVLRSKSTFTAPLTWRSPKRVFTCSWSDFFIAEADPWRDEAWAVIRRTPHLTYQILTKRPERIAGRLPWTTAPWPHVWLGVSVETPAYYGRIHVLRQIPAALRFLSLEPVLAPLPALPLDGFDWAIIGGESGAAAARPLAEDWVRDLVAQGRTAGVPVFVKQLGTVWARAHGGDPKGGDWTRWPADLRVRTFPLA